MFKTALPQAALLLVVILTLTGCSITHVMRIKDRQVIDVETMIGELRAAQVVLVGEVHTAPSHHKLQLDVIKNLRSAAKPLAIGMEMFEGPSQKTLDAWSAGQVSEAAFRKVFAWNWRNISWGLYEDILIYARDNGIPIIALNAPRELVQKVSQQGASSLSGQELEELPPGINLEVSDDYLNFMSSAYPVHGRSGEAFRNICQAQMLRNRVMARRIGDYLALHPGSTMVVLAGGGHTRENGGIPAELGNLAHLVVLPAIPGLSPGTVSGNDGDYLLEEPYSWLELLF